MSIQHPDSVGKVRKILLFETVFHDLVSDCTKLTLASTMTWLNETAILPLFRQRSWRISWQYL